MRSVISAQNELTAQLFFVFSSVNNAKYSAFKAPKIFFNTNEQITLFNKRDVLIGSINYKNIQ